MRDKAKIFQQEITIGFEMKHCSGAAKPRPISGGKAEPMLAQDCGKAVTIIASLLQSQPKLVVSSVGVRRQSEAATALWIPSILSVQPKRCRATLATTLQIKF